MSYLRARGRRPSIFSMPAHMLEQGLADEHERAYQRWNREQELGDERRDAEQDPHQLYGWELSEDDLKDDVA